jgi:endo-1,4-beta-mannosidase
MKTTMNFSLIIVWIILQIVEVGNVQSQNYKKISLTEPGYFITGCNYWASHAGTFMWRNWRSDIVDQDFQKLSTAGMQVLRVFPLWPDFQPITSLFTNNSTLFEVRFGEQLLPDDNLGKAGLSASAMDHFSEFLDLAQKHNLKLIVALLNGWMSGRLFTPPALEGKNLLTDPMAIKWELRFIHEFVKTFKNHPAILAWDLGNETNVMARVTRDQAYTWTATISNAIHAVDPTRPVVSGLHGLKAQGDWTMQDQGELTDVLTAHPYGLFTIYANLDPINTIKSIMHSTVESRYYSDIGGKPVLCEEIGTTGPMIASDEVAADFMRSCMFSLWANNCHGALWWCAFDLLNLEQAPYDWLGNEGQLGLFRSDGSKRPVLDAVSAFRKFIDALPFETLPEQQKDAICILTRDQDTWAVAYSSMILAKQAGFDMEFQFAEQPIKDASLYLLPSIEGSEMISRHRMMELLQKVENGASLYISIGDAFPGQFEQLTGLQPQTHQVRENTEYEIKLTGLDGTALIPGNNKIKIVYKNINAKVLGIEDDGNPAFTVANYGKGKVYFLSVPLEKNLTINAGSFHSANALPSWKVYNEFAKKEISLRSVNKSNAMLGITEHPVDQNHKIIVVINYSPYEIIDFLRINDGWKLHKTLYSYVENEKSQKLKIKVAKNNACVFSIIHDTPKN